MMNTVPELTHHNRFDGGSDTESEDGDFDDGPIPQTFEAFTQSQLMHPEPPRMLNHESIGIVAGKAADDLLALGRLSPFRDHEPRDEEQDAVYRSVNGK